MFRLSTVLAAFVIAVVPEVSQAQQITQPTNDVVLLTFTTPGCASCERVHPLIDELISKKYPLDVVEVTRTTNYGLAQDLKIKSFPTFVMLVGADEIDRIEGSADPIVLAPRIVQLFNQADKFVAGKEKPPIAQVSHSSQSPDSANTVSSAHFQTKVLLENGTSPWMASSVKLRVGDEGGFSWGTGTIIDVRGGKSLILTCGHLFRDSQGKGKIDVYLPVPSGGYRQVNGSCYRYNLDCDLGFVVIQQSESVQAIPLAEDKFDLQAGDTVMSVGCDGGADPTERKHAVISLDRVFSSLTSPRFSYIQVNGAPVQGRSGGGLFSETGCLIGVCVTAGADANDGHFVPCSVIRSELEAAKLQNVLAGQSLNDTKIKNAPGPIVLASGRSERSLSDIGPEAVVEPLEHLETLPRHEDADPSAHPLKPYRSASLEELRQLHAEGVEILCTVSSGEQKGETFILQPQEGPSLRESRFSIR